MRVGVRDTGDGNIAAHAWLLSGDRIVMGDRADHFLGYRKITDFI